MKKNGVGVLVLCAVFVGWAGVVPLPRLYAAQPKSGEALSLAKDTSEFEFDQALRVSSVGLRLLGQLNKDPSKTTPILPFIWKELNQDLQQVYGTPSSRGVIVAGVLPALLPEGIDLKRGDELLLFQGVPVYSQDDVESALERTGGLDWVTLQFRRGEKIWNLRIPLLRVEFYVPFRVSGNMLDAFSSFSLVGGDVVVSTPLLRFVENDDELAFILAHELAHVTGRLPLTILPRPQSRAQRLGMEWGEKLGGFSADFYFAGKIDFVQAKSKLQLIPHLPVQEADADRQAVEWMAKAGFDPSAAETILERLAVEIPADREYSIVKIHPISDDRLVLLHRECEKVKNTAEWSAGSGSGKGFPEDLLLGPTVESRANPGDIKIRNMGLAKGTGKRFLNAKKPLQDELIFDADTKKIVWFVQFDNIKSLGNLFKRPQFSVEWYAPNGELAHRDEFKTSSMYPDMAETKLKIDSDKTRSGRWRVIVSRDGAPFDDRAFLIREQ